MSFITKSLSNLSERLKDIEPHAYDEQNIIFASIVCFGYMVLIFLVWRQTPLQTVYISNAHYQGKIFPRLVFYELCAITERQPASCFLHYIRVDLAQVYVSIILQLSVSAARFLLLLICHPSA